MHIARAITLSAGLFATLFLLHTSNFASGATSSLTDDGYGYSGICQAVTFDSSSFGGVYEYIGMYNSMPEYL
ncbi:unnamed protein product, partial [Choristocarpus tenellus]